MKSATFNRLAKHELADAAQYYEDRRNGLGVEFLDAAQDIVAFLGQHPQAGRRIRGVIRRFALARFPCFLLYRPLDGGGIRVLAVAHKRRNPEYWVGRA